MLESSVAKYGIAKYKVVECDTAKPKLIRIATLISSYIVALLNSLSGWLGLAEPGPIALLETKSLSILLEKAEFYQRFLQQDSIFRAEKSSWTFHNGLAKL